MSALGSRATIVSHVLKQSVLVAVETIGTLSVIQYFHMGPQVGTD